jgi:cathepsin L
MSPFTPLTVLLLAGVAMAATSEWNNFKLQHSKLYSDEEDVSRMNIWKKNVAMVEKHNSEDHSYTMAINKFSDWTNEEFNAFLGYQQQSGEKFNVKTFENVATPDSVDYRNENRVTPVKDQGQCGSCWAFSATGGIEGVWSKNMGELVSVSEQQMVDCVSGNDCAGGHMINGWNHVASVGGIQSEESYPYTAQNGNCQFQDDMVVSHIAGYEQVPANEDQMEAALVEIGYPLSIAVHAGSSFQHYSSGVYHDSLCKYQGLNHAILIVGYEKTGSDPYWIVKNSWGSGWGEAGYIKMRMGANVCGLKKDVSYPTM